MCLVGVSVAVTPWSVPPPPKHAALARILCAGRISSLILPMKVRQVFDSKLNHPVSGATSAAVGVGTGTHQAARRQGKRGPAKALLAS